jgi:hypothetical protein
MNKFNIILSSICTLTSISSFGMLTKTSSIHKIATYKNIKSFHTNSPIYNQKTYSEAKDVNDKAQKILDKANINNELLHKIIEQNEQNNKILKENNLLLRTIVKQNYIYKYHGQVVTNKKELQKRSEWLQGYYPKDTADLEIQRHQDLLEHFYSLKKQYGIDVTSNLEE